MRLKKHQHPTIKTICLTIKANTKHLMCAWIWVFLREWCILNNNNIYIYIYIYIYIS